jgi:hypothetical protein
MKPYNKNMQEAPLFRGEPFSKILCDLEKIESESGLFQGRKKARHVFLTDRNQAQISNYAQRFMQWKPWARAICGRCPAKTIFTAIGKTTSIAQNIKVKNNLIAFYPSHGFICKFKRNSGIRKFDNLEKEAKTIITARKTSFFKVPELLLENSTKDTRAIWMRQVKGKKPKKSRIERTKIAARFLKAMFLWYEYHGIDFINVDEFILDAKGKMITQKQLLSVVYHILDTLRLKVL